VGAPVEYLKVECINDRYDSFEYSLEKATVSPATALATARRRDLRRRFGDEIGHVDDGRLALLTLAEDEYMAAAQERASVVEEAAREVRLMAVEAGAREAAKEKGDKGASDEGSMMRMFGQGEQLEKRLQEAVKCSIAAEVEYLKTISKILGDEVKADEERRGLARLVADRPFSWQPDVAPLELPRRHHSPLEAPQGKEGKRAQEPEQSLPPRCFVLEFFGDIQASQVENLRQEVTAVVGHASAARGDTVVLVLNTGGGTVTGYGLAAAQLQRLKAAGLHLTICVEQVAASGGYMMACIADRLVAAPFAVLGSIGVITDIPNVYDRLSKEGIAFQTITAGKYKRTLTPTKKVTPEDVAKTKEDIEAIFKLFRGFVGQNRPQLDLEEVATGETWFGQDALERKLVDELTSSDDILLNLRKQGAMLYSVKYRPPAASPFGALVGSFDAPAAGVDGNALAMLAARLLEVTTGRPAGALERLASSQDWSARPDQAYLLQDTRAQDLLL